MQIEIQLTSAPIAAPWPSAPRTGAGAWVDFRGVVRGEEHGQPIAALEYEAYSPMAEREIRRILEEITVDRPCLFAQVIHRVGVIPVGEAAIYVGVAATHRVEAFALLTQFMDRLKQDVPIWKRRAFTAAELAAVQSTKSACLANPPAASPIEVLALTRRLCLPLDVIGVSLAEAEGRVLRAPVRASEDQPPFDRSSVDGFAVRQADRTTTFRIVDEIRAGDWKPRALQAGEAVRIATGGAMPGEGLRVVMKEDAQVEADQLTVLRHEDERNIRMRGEDARLGQVLVEAGAVLSPGALALLASAGCAQPLVTRLPRVLHLATGNEIVPPDQVPAPGQIRDCNSTLVRAFLSPWNVIPEQRRVAEDAERIKLEIRNPKSEIVDLLLISGGASVGDHDFTRRLLEESGFTIHVSQTTARPGKPLIVAQHGKTLAFGLPGNPLAHFVCLHLYVRAALEGFLGQSLRTAFTTGMLTTDLTAGGNTRETFWPARWMLGDGIAMLTPLRWSSSGDLTALATANALIRVTAGAGRFPRGSRLEFLRTERSA
jgi:molybdopterin molybdotransferase